MTKIYDFPLRLFHGLFALSFIGAYLLADQIDSESAVFTIHMILGLYMTHLLIFRFALGIWGSRTSLFSDLVFAPRKLFSYLLSVGSRKGQKLLGHNPASSWAALTMFTLTIGLTFSGIAMTRRFHKSFFEEVHEICVDLFLITILFHVLGVIFHQVVHRDGMALSMFTGTRKMSGGESNSPPKSSAVISALMTGIMVLSLYMITIYNPDSQKFSIYGIPLFKEKVPRGQLPQQPKSFTRKTTRKSSNESI